MFARCVDVVESLGRMDTLMTTVPAVGATGGRPREPMYLDDRTKWRGPYSPALMIAGGDGFAPAPGDRRSPLQVEDLAMIGQ